jgi:hypothetical protein
MRRIMFSVVAGLAILAIAPASVLAKHHSKRHHARTHHAKVHRARVRHERFGTITAPTGTTTTPTTPPAASPAGTVNSFDGTTLVIRLADNSLVSGTVTPNTEIECQAADTDDSNVAMHADGDHGGGGDQGNSGGGDENGGGGGDEQGGDENGSATCTTANLVQGATVTGAELGISSTGATWDKVELAG